jgi:ubiquinone/menaquinone biosynthesis C-methylase UbiE
MPSPQPPADAGVYDRLAPCYDRRWRRYIEATTERARGAIALQPGQRVLDLAAGTGELAHRLHRDQPSAAVVAVDASLPMLRQATSKQSSPGWLPVQASADRLPFPEAAFDHVACINAFHRFTRPERAMAEIRRVLRPGGQLTLLDWCHDYLTCKLMGFWLKRIDPTIHHIYTLDQLRRLMQAQDLSIDRADRFRVGVWWGLMQLQARK